MRWSPRVTVATVVERDGRFLLVEERTRDGLVLNQPAGHWEAGETLFDAAIRETREETAWDVRLTALIGVYEFQPAALDYSFLRFTFAATAIAELPARALDPAIERALWMDLSEIQSQSARHRSPMVARSLHDYLGGRRFPLDLVAHL